MTHTKAYCRGRNREFTCKIRDTCLRYQLYQDPEIRANRRELHQTIDLGYGFHHHFDILKGCCEYIKSE